MTAILLFCLLHLGPQAQAPKSFDYGKLSEFTKSPTEHVIYELGRPIDVSSIRGFITDSGGHALANVIFEIRKKSLDAVRRTMTDSHGRFSMRGAAAGTYDFKATLDGFQSVVGVIIVSGKLVHNAKIHIEMRTGV